MRTVKTLLILLPLAGALSACGGTAPAPERDLEAAQQKVHAFAPWGESYDKLVADLGEPDTADGDTYVWRKPSGDQCQRLTVKKMAEAVGTVDLSTGPCE